MHVLYDLGDNYFSLTSALFPEGISYVNKVMIIFVDHNYCSESPWKDAYEYCSKFTDCRNTVIFMTAAKNYIFKEIDFGKIIMSAGIGESAENAGKTINIGVFLNAGVNINGLVDLIRTITEAKSGALMDLSMKITGTVSDAIAVGAKVGNMSFLGPGTELGKKVALEVRETLKFLLRKD